MKEFSIIVAIDEKSGIGKSGELPWRLSRDMQRFKDLTMICLQKGKMNALIMGRKTWDSLPERFRPLPGRLNLVLSSQKDLLLPSGVLCSSSLEQALQELKSREEVGNIFVIGGGRVFAEAIGRADCKYLYITHIAADFLCDVYFPIIPDRFFLEKRSELLEEDGIMFRFVDYMKK